MNTGDFLSLVLPDEGYKFIAEHNGYLRHTACKTVDEMVGLVAEHRVSGRNTELYFACSSFNRDKYIVMDAGKEKVKQRTAEDALYAKSFWLDIDCGFDKHGKLKDYETQGEALEALDTFCEQTGLPRPLRVSSGNGIHCYWPLTEKIESAKWVKIAEQFKQLTVQKGLNCDPSRTSDRASLLRPVGSIHCKDKENIRPVTVLAEHDRLISPIEFAKIVLSQVRGVAAAPQRTKAVMLNSDLAMPEQEYPPSSAKKIVANCAQIRFFSETGSDSEPHWRACLGTLKHTIEGDAICHEYSKKYKGYSIDECQEKIDGWKLAPPKCDTFANHNNLCEGCPHHLKGRSPISLGFESEAVIEVADPVQPEQTVQIDLPWPFKRNPVTGALCYNVVDKDGNEGEEKTVCNVFFTFSHLFRSIDETLMVRMQVYGDQKTPKGHTDLKGRLFGEKGRALHGTLGDQGIVARPGQEKQLEFYVTSYLEKLMREVKETKAYRTFGWQDDGGYLIGESLYTPEGDVKQVMLGSEDAKLFVRDNTFPDLPNADAKRWGEIINEMYNHPDHEQYQFVIYMAFGAPLMELFGIDTGAPINLYGAGGKGKTTAFENAMSIMGNPKKFGSAWKTGTTPKAFFNLLGIFRSMLVLCDEITNLDASDASDLIYTIGNGVPREGLKSDGSRSSAIKQRWRLMTGMTSNSDLSEKLTINKDDASAELARLIQIQWRSDVHTIEKSRMIDLQKELQQHYGAVGRQLYIPLITQQRDKIDQILGRMQRKIDEEAGLGKEHRFWSAALAATATGGFLATKVLKLLDFDFDAVFKMIVDEAIRHRIEMAAKTQDPLESFNSIINTLSSSIIRTHTEGGRNAVQEVRIATGKAPAGRLIAEKDVLYVSITALHEICNNRQISFNRMKDAVHAAGWMIDSNVKYYLGKGTNITAAQTRCWMLSASKVTGIYAHEKVSHLTAVNG